VITIKAIIPAAGYATRLYPLTENFPKPLLPVGGRPMLVHVIEKILEIKEVDQIFIVTNSRFMDHFEDWKNSYSCPIPIVVLNDGTTSVDNRLGAIGDIQFAITNGNIDDDVLMVASDNLFSFSLKGMYELFKQKQKAIIALYDVRDFEIAKRMGLTKRDENGKVIDFKEKPDKAWETLIAICVYLMPKQVVKMIKTYLDAGNSPDKPGEYIEWLHKNDDVYAHIFDNPDDQWLDIGDLKCYEEANKMYGGEALKLSDIEKKEES